MTVLIEYLKIVTYNINLNRISISASKDWNEQKNTEALVKEIFNLNPDIFTLQEIPYENFCNHFADKYQYSTPVPSHSGYSSTFVKKHMTSGEQVIKPPFSGWKIRLTRNKEVILLGGHLLPFDYLAQKRFENLQETVNFFNPDEGLIIFGDMNMRENETKNVIDQLGLKDAFIEFGEPSNEKYTWNSNINLFWENSQQYTARYDRVFYRNLQLVEFHLIFNKPVRPNSNHFLSDHFGVFASIKV